MNKPKKAPHPLLRFLDNHYRPLTTRWWKWWFRGPWRVLTEQIPFRLRWGCYPMELWSLDETLLDWLIPRLIAFRSCTHGYPVILRPGETIDQWNALPEGEGEARWKAVLDTMIEGLEAPRKADEQPWSHEAEEEAEKKLHAALALLNEHFRSLWD